MTEPERQADVKELAEKIAPDATIKEQLDALRRLLRLQDRHLSQAGGVSVTTIRRWRAHGTDDLPDGLENLRAVVEEVAGSGRKSPRAIGAWLRSRNRALGFERPIDLVHDADAETVGWIVEAGLAFANAYSLPEASPQGTPVPKGSGDLGGRVGKAPATVPVSEK
jgi:hypothetical protein